MLLAHLALHQDAKALHDLIVERFKASCPVKLRRVYKIASRGPSHFDQYGGRIIYVTAAVCGFDSLFGRWRFAVSGPLARPSISHTRNGYFGGRFTSKHVQVPVSRIDLSSEQDPPKEVSA